MLLKYNMCERYILKVTRKSTDGTFIISDRVHKRIKESAFLNIAGVAMVMTAVLEDKAAS